MATLASTEALLKQKVNNGLRTEFGTRTISQIVSGERSELMDEALKQSSQSSDELEHELLGREVEHLAVGVAGPDVPGDRVHQMRLAETDPAQLKQALYIAFTLFAVLNLLAAAVSWMRPATHLSPST